MRLTLLDASLGRGRIYSALTYATENPLGGLAADQDLPYTDYNGQTTETCRDTAVPLDVQVIGPRYVLRYYIDDNIPHAEKVQRVKSALAKNPVAFTMRTKCDVFKYYKNGVLTDEGGCRCTSGRCPADHAMLLVG